jgi:ketosteroid isomerase-like protein
MTNMTPSLVTETEGLKEAYAALNRNDIPNFVKIFDEEIEWVEFAESPGGGSYKGRATVEAHATQARGTWAEGACEPERFIVAGDKIIVFVYVHVRLKHETEWREGRIADVYTFRHGKVIHMRNFLERAQALEWAGAEALDTN